MLDLLNSFRWVAGAATTPLLPADYLDLVAPLHGSALRARVERVSRETKEATTLALRAGRGWAGHDPGQFLRVGVDIDGVRYWRSYSITSRPQDRIVTITVKRQGLVSEHLCRLEFGDVIVLEQAVGEFTVPAQVPDKVLFVTAGSGITPVMGILRSHRLPDVVVVHSAPSACEVIFGDELRALARQDGLQLIERHTATEGRIGPEQLLALVPDIAERATWVCGPNDLIDDLATLFDAKGWKAPVSERFRPPASAISEEGSVQFQHCGVAVETAGSTSLLEAGESAGVLLPSGCRMGICYGCVTPLTQGSVRDLRDGTLTTADDKPVLIQTCINAAAGPAVLDA